MCITTVNVTASGTGFDVEFGDSGDQDVSALLISNNLTLNADVAGGLTTTTEGSGAGNEVQNIDLGGADGGPRRHQEQD